MKKRALVLIPLSLLTLLLAILFSQQRITIRPVQAATGAASVFFSLSDQTLGSDGVNIAVGDLDGDDDIDAFVAMWTADKVWINQGGTQGGVEGYFADSSQSLGSNSSSAVALDDLDIDDDVLWINQGGAAGNFRPVPNNSPRPLLATLSCSILTATLISTLSWPAPAARKFITPPQARSLYPSSSASPYSKR